MGIFSGPMFSPATGAHSQSVFRKSGSHYNIYEIRNPDAGFALLQEWFPDAEADQLNFVLFSTSGVHGSYITLEEIEAGLRAGPTEEGEHTDVVTILVVSPRIVSMQYGNCRVTLENIEYLKKLRASSWAAVQMIGRKDETP